MPKSLKVTMVNFRTIYIESDVNAIEVTKKYRSDEIIQTFRRYNYEITSEHYEDDYINNLKERSDYQKYQHKK
jgi:hypothetical protein